MSSEVNPQEVVDVILPGGGAGRTTRDHAARAGFPIVEKDAPKAVVVEPRKPRGRRPAPPVEADESTD